MMPQNGGVFPYRDLSGQNICDSLCHQEASQQRAQAAAGGGRASASSDKLHCKICEDGRPGRRSERVLLAPDKMRAHIATHILRGDISQSACGYCGKETGPCVVSLEGGQSTKAAAKRPDFAKGVADGKIVDLDTKAHCVSSCTHFYSFSLASAKKANERKNCSNVPLTCAGCWLVGNKTTVVCKYAMPQHYANQHAGKPLPAEYKVGAGEAQRLWNASLHPGDVAPLREYQEPPAPALPWTYNLAKPYVKKKAPHEAAAETLAAMLALAPALAAAAQHQQTSSAAQQ